MTAAAIDIKSPGVEWAFDVEHQAKRRLERQLGKDLSALNRKMARAYGRELLERGRVLDLEYQFGAVYRQLLEGHYSVVGQSFGGRLSRLLPAGVRATSSERASIQRRLLTVWPARAAEQGARIAATTARHAQQSLALVRTAAQETGETLSERQIARRAQAVLARKLDGRSPGITSLETQAPAELAKRTELDVLAGGLAMEMRKRWWSSGDHRTREWHLMADQQEQPVDAPFDVRGEMLMQPGDTSLGASLANVVNCRCSTQYDTDALAKMRAGGNLA